MRLSSTLAAAAVFLLGVAACEPLFLPSTFPVPEFDDDGNVVKTTEAASMKFHEGKLEVSAAVLNRGKVVYRTYCSSCHGLKGDGQGPSAKGLTPPPRNFTPINVAFKFASVKSGELPPDNDLVRTVRTGLHGTAMLEWDLNEERLREVLQYIKTFSSRWQFMQVGASIPLASDPYGDAKKAEAVERGKQLYYAVPQCHLCHPAYVNQSEFDSLRASAQLTTGPLRADAGWSVAKMSDVFGVNVIPPDFTWHDMRSAKQVDPNASSQVQAQQKAERRTDLFRAIATGIGGTAMPTWKDAIPDADIWAIVYYVDTLIDLKSNPAAREALMAPLRGKK